MKKSVSEILEFPRWELESWKEAFRVWGPLDWTRADWLDARDVASRYGESGDLIEDYLMFAPPRPAQTEEEMAALIEGFSPDA